MNQLDAGQSQNTMASSGSLRQIAVLFLKLGMLGFGGPAAHIAMMHEEVVNRRRWMSREEFLDLLGATNLIPGPNSTELAIHIGHRQHRWPGLIVAGCCFILPAAVVVTIGAWAYVRYGSFPEAAALLYGVKPVIIAIVLQALWELGRAAIKTKFLALLFAAGAALAFEGMHELAILFAGAVASGLGHQLRHPKVRNSGLLAVGPIALLGQTAVATSAMGVLPFSIWTLFLFFLKVGSVLFGSGYVLLAFMRADLVERYHWLTESQLLDAIAIGQATPGPLFTTATFIGYLLGGLLGATVSTFGIFLPAFFFVAVSGPFLPQLRRSPTAGAVLDGINTASLSLMAVVSYQLGHAALIDIPAIILAIASAFVMVRFRINSAWLVLGGAAVGLTHYVKA